MERNNQVHETVRLGKNISMGFNNLIFEDVTIGDDVQIGSNVIIHPNTRIGNNVKIQDGAILGKKNFISSGTGSSSKFFGTEARLSIGDGVTIGTGAICYFGTEVGEGSIIADRAIVREGCRLGKGVKVGKQTIVEYQVVLGDGVSIQAQVLIGEMMKIGKHTFIGPHVSTACDMYMDASDRDALNPPKIRDGVRVGENATILPGVEIGENSVLSAGSIAGRDIPPGVVAIGFPAKAIRKVKNKGRDKSG